MELFFKKNVEKNFNWGKKRKKKLKRQLFSEGKQIREICRQMQTIQNTKKQYKIKSLMVTRSVVDVFYPN